MTGESHTPGRKTFAVPKGSAGKFTIGEPVGLAVDLHGDPIVGRVVEVKEGSGIALVIVEVDGV